MERSRTYMVNRTQAQLEAVRLLKQGKQYRATPLPSGAVEFTVKAEKANPNKES